MSWKRSTLNLCCLAGICLLIGFAGYLLLQTRLAMSGMPPHPGPMDREPSYVLTEVQRLNQGMKERIALAQEQQAKIATNRQTAIHRAARKKVHNETLQEAKTESQMAGTALTEQQLQHIEKNKAKDIRRAARAADRKEV